MTDRKAFEKWWNEELLGCSLEIEKKAAHIGWQEATSRQQEIIDTLRRELEVKTSALRELMERMR